MDRTWLKVLNHTLIAAVGLGLLYLCTALYLGGYTLVALVVLVAAVLLVITYTWSKAYTWRYLFPGFVGFGLFVIFPLSYTVYISFTNYSSANLLRHEQVVRYFEDERYLAADARYAFQLYRTAGSPERYRIVLTDRNDDQQLYASPDLELPTTPTALQVEPVTAGEASLPTVEPLPLRDIIRLRAGLQNLSLTLPPAEGEEEGLTLTNTGLRDFAPNLPLWRHDADTGRLTKITTGEEAAPDFETGTFRLVADGDTGTAGTAVGPGFRTFVGLDNYLRVFTDKGIQGPFLKIFIWTVLFSLGSVACSLAVGMFLAVLLQWKELPFRRGYRTLLIMPYAVPAFISILIFKGLFNQNFGEINLILNALFGIQPEWFANPTLAKIMILIVNTWLGFPYMMIVCTGILQSVPDTIYEASAIDGSNALHDFFKLTLPLIFKPLFPLLVASFAFNFNNFLLIYLLTGGGPDMVGASTVAGETDILVSYTFRIAFRDTAQNFGYASAIATVIFIIVALISWWNLRNRADAR